MDFAVPADHRVKNQRKRKEKQLLWQFQRTKKAMGHEGDDDSNCKWSTENDP